MRYEVMFVDGSAEIVDAETAGEAKGAAKNRRREQVDPGGQRARSGGQAADVASDPRVKVRWIAKAATSLAIWLGLAAIYALDTWLGARALAIAHAGVLEMMAFSGTAIGATIAALTAVSGDSAIVPFFPEAKKAWLLQLWADVQVAGTARLRSPKWHDNVNGIRVDTVISEVTPMIPPGARQPLNSGETLIAELAGSAVAGDIEFLVLLRYFEELSAQHSRLITADEALKRAVNILTFENTIATVATGVWGGSEAINAEIDQLHTRKQYALLGYLCDTEAAAIAWRGPDFANVRLGGPGTETERDVTVDWFLYLSRLTGLPLVPVFQSDNKAATLIEALQDENGADTTVTTILAELSPQ